MSDDPRLLTPHQRAEWQRMALSEPDPDQRSAADLVVGKLLAHADAMDERLAAAHSETSSDIDLLALARSFCVASMYTDEERTRSRDEVMIEWRGGDTYCVRAVGNVLDRDGDWVYEPMPSSRTDEFIQATRFTLAEALERAAKALPALRTHMGPYGQYLHSHIGGLDD